jgi:hypothetical protein
VLVEHCAKPAQANGKRWRRVVAAAGAELVFCLCGVLARSNAALVLVLEGVRSGIVYAFSSVLFWFLVQKTTGTTITITTTHHTTKKSSSTYLYCRTQPPNGTKEHAERQMLVPCKKLMETRITSDDIELILNEHPKRIDVLS